MHRRFEALRDPGISGGVVLIGMAAVGLFAIALAWRGMAAELDVSLQVPFVVSGGFGGPALAGASTTLFAIHLERRAAASRRADLDQIVRTAAAMADVVGRQHTARVARRYVVVRSTVHRPDCRLAVHRLDAVRITQAEARAHQPPLRVCRICRPRTD